MSTDCSEACIRGRGLRAFDLFSAVQWADAQSNLDRTTAVLLKFAQTFSQPTYTDVVTSIQVLNEPASQSLSSARTLFGR